MALCVEMSGHFMFILLMFYQIEMTLEPCFQSILCLSNILFTAFFAVDAVYEVVAHTVYIFHTCVCAPGCV